ncbi:sperm flagellar protein 1 [Nilaparvata lugens]|uniref:sperm flagellar protein 1 n=1 Tax=Nilaparvata lugens TaxID=108931 RepID=UPI00193D3652|nr:sperm flagellar protein 1 [Nilaparvata lugens]
MSGSIKLSDDWESNKEELYAWIDEFELSRPKKCLNRDFSDGVLVAEILKILYPRLVELHNYASASSRNLKIENWTTLNRKVLKKLKLNLKKEQIFQIVDAVPGAIESFLMRVKKQIDLEKMEQQKDNNSDSQDSSFLDSLDEQIESAALLEKIQNLYKNEAKLNKTLSEKDATIGKLESRVKHLEEILELKDQRIEDLMRCAKKENHIVF